MRNVAELAAQLCVSYFRGGGRGSLFFFPLSCYLKDSDLRRKRKGET